MMDGVKGRLDDVVDGGVDIVTDGVDGEVDSVMNRVKGGTDGGVVRRERKWLVEERQVMYEEEGWEWLRVEGNGMIRG